MPSNEECHQSIQQSQMLARACGHAHLQRQPSQIVLRQAMLRLRVKASTRMDRLVRQLHVHVETRYRACSFDTIVKRQ